MSSAECICEMQHQCHRGDQRGGGAVGGARGEAGAGAEGDAVGGYQCAGGGPGRDAGNAVSKGGVRGRMVRQGRNLEKHTRGKSLIS